MIKTIEELKFNKAISELIEKGAQVFLEQQKGRVPEESQMSLLEWINGSIESLTKDGVLAGFSYREKFLFVFGAYVWGETDLTS